MASRRSRPRRFLLPTLLAAVLAAEITGIALARTLTPSTPAATDSAAASAAVTASTASGGSARVGDRGVATDDSGDTGSSGLDQPRFGVVDRVPLPPTIGPASTFRTHRLASAPAISRATASSHATSYHGTNHVWIPSLGINKGVQSFPCSRSRPPDAGVYRWGCAGHNNVYLLGHAWSTFKPLHDAYVSGRLHTGMKVVYADGSSRVHTYSVTWWRVVAPTTAASWAWAALSRPSMTLQTCVGANSQYRLMVRLIEVA